jgi:hypothetical protein
MNKLSEDKPPFSFNQSLRLNFIFASSLQRYSERALRSYRNATVAPPQVLINLSLQYFTLPLKLKFPYNHFKVSLQSVKVSLQSVSFFGITLNFPYNQFEPIC